MKQDINVNHGILSVEPLVDEITKAKIRRHLSDINDKITEEDLKNIRTSFLPAGNITKLPVPERP